MIRLPEQPSNRLARGTTACGKQPEVPNYPILLLLNLRLDPARPFPWAIYFSCFFDP